MRGIEPSSPQHEQLGRRLVVLIAFLEEKLSVKKGFVRSVFVNMLAAIVNGWTFSVFLAPIITWVPK